MVYTCHAQDHSQGERHGQPMLRRVQAAWRGRQRPNPAERRNERQRRGRQECGHPISSHNLLSTLRRYAMTDQMKARPRRHATVPQPEGDTLPTYIQLAGDALLAWYDSRGEGASRLSVAYRKACNRRTSYDDQVRQDMRALALAATLLEEAARLPQSPQLIPPQPPPVAPAVPADTADATHASIPR